jgi:hypothetical protein
MAIGIVISMLKRGNFSISQAGITLLLITAGLVYMFLFANN